MRVKIAIETQFLVYEPRTLLLDSLELWFAVHNHLIIPGSSSSCLLPTYLVLKYIIAHRFFTRFQKCLYAANVFI